MVLVCSVMSSQPAFLFDEAAFDADAIQTVLAMAEGLGRTMCIARTLVEHGRTVDLAGLDRGVGLLCAKSLDLPPDAGRAVRPTLAALLEEADRLTEALGRNAPD